MSKTTIRTRERGTGKYANEQTRPCVCGHVAHTADRVLVDGKPFQPCMKAIDGSYLEPGEALCECQEYRPAKAKRRESA